LFFRKKNNIFVKKEIMGTTIFFLFGYLIGYIGFAILFYMLAKELYNMPTKSGYFCYRDEISAIKYNKEALCVVTAITWPITWAFIVGCSLGYEIHKNMIIKNNEEIRIASWFV
jgi:hypothetical protein